ncbi:MAG: response regulator [Candidatus Sericytochromatia bacterium]|nr:response regulator [Candidatus Sericytochromatia bacterium]
MAAILVVDDDQDIREALIEILSDEGHTASGAGNGAEALVSLRQFPRPDLILLDLMMPVMNGWDFTAEIAKDPVLSQIPVVLLSGGGELQQHADSLRVTAFLVKPIKVDALLTMVEAVSGAA